MQQDDGTIVWDSDHVYESLESMIHQHSIQPNGMVTLLTDGCPVRYYIVQDSLFPGHQVKQDKLIIIKYFQFNDCSITIQLSDFKEVRFSFSSLVFCN